MPCTSPPAPERVPELAAGLTAVPAAASCLLRHDLAVDARNCLGRALSQACDPDALVAFLSAVWPERGPGHVVLCDGIDGAVREPGTITIAAASLWAYAAAGDRRVLAVARASEVRAILSLPPEMRGMTLRRFAELAPIAHLSFGASPESNGLAGTKAMPQPLLVQPVEPGAAAPAWLQAMGSASADGATRAGAVVDALAQVSGEVVALVGGLAAPGARPMAPARSTDGLGAAMAEIDASIDTPDPVNTDASRESVAGNASSPRGEGSAGGGSAPPGAERTAPAWQPDTRMQAGEVAQRAGRPPADFGAAPGNVRGPDETGAFTAKSTTSFGRSSPDASDRESRPASDRTTGSSAQGDGVAPDHRRAVGEMGGGLSLPGEKSSASDDTRSLEGGDPKANASDQTSTRASTGLPAQPAVSTNESAGGDAAPLDETRFLSNQQRLDPSRGGIADAGSRLVEGSSEGPKAPARTTDGLVEAEWGLDTKAAVPPSRHRQGADEASPLDRPANPDADRAIAGSRLSFDLPAHAPLKTRADRPPSANDIRGRDERPAQGKVGPKDVGEGVERNAQDSRSLPVRPAGDRIAAPLPSPVEEPANPTPPNLRHGETPRQPNAVAGRAMHGRTYVDRAQGDNTKLADADQPSVREGGGDEKNNGAFRTVAEMRMQAPGAFTGSQDVGSSVALRRRSNTRGQPTRGAITSEHGGKGHASRIGSGEVETGDAAIGIEAAAQTVRGKLGIVSGVVAILMGLYAIFVLHGPANALGGILAIGIGLYSVRLQQSRTIDPPKAWEDALRNAEQSTVQPDHDRMERARPTAARILPPIEAVLPEYGSRARAWTDR